METETQEKILPGQEPERLQRYIGLLFADLNRVFPNKIVDPSLWQHDRWDQATALLCKELGYRTGEDFLSAYGYLVASIPGSRLLDADRKPASATAGEPPEAAGPAEPGDANGAAEGADRAAETAPDDAAADRAEDTPAADTPADDNQAKPTLVGSIRAWWARFASGPVKKAAHERRPADEQPGLDAASTDENAAGAEEGAASEQEPTMPAEENAAIADEGAAEQPEGTRAEADGAQPDDLSAPAEDEVPSDAAAEVPEEAPASPDAAGPDVYDEAAYREIPLDEPAVHPDEREAYTGKHSKLSPEAQPDDAMQALLQEFADADVPPESELPARKREKPPAKPRVTQKPAPARKREYTPKELFEATFGGIEVEEEQEDVGRIFEDEEPQERTSAFIKKISARYKAKEKTFAVVFAGILILAVLAVFLRILLDRHEAAVQAQQEALAAAEQNITYVDTGSFNVSVTLPAVYTEDPDLTQKEYNVLAEEEGYNKILLQTDGSLIYVMSRSRQYQMCSEITAEVVAFFDGIPDSSAYPEISSVEPDSDYTTVKITLTGNDEPVHMATLATDMAYYCGKVQRVNGANLPTLVITVYSKSGEKLNTYKPTCP